MFESFHEFRSRPGVSAVIVITIALGVAGATSMFAMLGAIGGAMVPPGVDTSRDRPGGLDVARRERDSGHADRAGVRQRRRRHQRLRVARASGPTSRWSWETMGRPSPSSASHPTFSERSASVSRPGANSRAMSTRGARPASSSQASASFGAFRPTASASRSASGPSATRSWASSAIAPGIPTSGTDVWMPLPSSRDGSPLVDSVWVAVTAALARPPRSGTFAAGGRQRRG